MFINTTLNKLASARKKASAVITEVKDEYVALVDHFHAGAFVAKGEIVSLTAAAAKYELMANKIAKVVADEVETVAKDIESAI